MLGTIYVGMAGMNAYTKGLDVISNNVANLNTLGYKAGTASFAEVVFRNSSGATSGSAGPALSRAGVHVNSEQQDFTQGEKRDTTNDLDVMLQGNGFFVFERDGQRYYSRGGQFDFDRDGYLIEKNTKARVMVTTDNSSVGPLQIDPYRVSQPKASTEVKIAGNLPRASTNPVPLTGVTVYDSGGSKHVLKINFNPADDPAPTSTDPNAPAAPPAELTWKVEILDDKEQVIGHGTLLFNADGTPAASNTTITATVKPDSLAEYQVNLNFGEAGKFSGLTSLIGNTNNSVAVLKTDGHDLGSIGAMLFDERGNLELTYSNQEKLKIGRLLLARFDAIGDLSSVGDGLYVTQQGRDPLLGGALDFGLGSVAGKRLEMSNVDLTQQFGDLIIIQRGYQACSQMTSVANEMMQQLLAMQSGK